MSVLSLGWWQRNEDASSPADDAGRARPERRNGTHQAIVSQLRQLLRRHKQRPLGLWLSDGRRIRIASAAQVVIGPDDTIRVTTSQGHVCFHGHELTVIELPPAKPK